MSADKKKTKQEGGTYETIKVIVQALLLALVVRTFLFQPFSIPSGSMKDTLLINDYLFVSKFSYGYSRYSFPFGLPLFSGRVWSSAPERGDVAVFKLPTDNKTDYIKRVIGLPGDKIQVRDSILYINGEQVERRRIDDYIEKDSYGNVRRVPRYVETLPNGVSYDTLDLTSRGSLDNTKVYTVPANHYFMMGDNRDNSADSRVGSVGPVPFENFVGRADIIFFSLEEGQRAWMVWKWPWTVRWSRIGTPL
ncbi:signal peptidase I [Flexibacterium corallicola]|uniref:signal peptidase I n=1 Tax=Flexibacterium corallicola TaxID=3037259 RepID=UPI00286F840A|nr:signal peptidase I [Pseudovibrio sp. M1P-2-3]